MKNLSKISVIASLLLPSFALAATQTVSGLISLVGLLLRAIVPLLIGLGLAYFLWGVFLYIKAGADEGGKQDAKKTIINGIIGLFVMVSVWGLVNLIQNSLSIGGGTVVPPKIP